MPPDAHYRPDPAFAPLAGELADVVAPAIFPRVTLRHRNDRAAAEVGLATLTDDEWAAAFARFAPLPENLPAPLALRYHGHQFDAYNPDLGDGRGFLFAQLRDRGGRLLDLATKGSGTTPWSRGGDGRLTLKGGVRELLATEMLGALGVSTSRTFSLFETGESLIRGDEPSPTRSSVLVRLGHSHVRFGTFQRLAYRREADTMKRLFAYVTEHLVPAATPGELLAAIVRRSADLCATWMLAGFVHGVLNSDNMNVTGESFDYGPYRFLPRYDPAFTAAYFDHGGLYAYGRQPVAVAKNLQRMGQALTTIAAAPELSAALATYEDELQRAVRARFLGRLGVASRGEDPDAQLLGATFDFLSEAPLGYEQLFFDWQGGAVSEARALASPDRAAYSGAGYLAFRRALEGADAVAPARIEHPYYRRPRPCALLIDELEALWEAIATRDDWTPLEAKLAAIREMGEALGAP